MLPTNISCCAGVKTRHTLPDHPTSGNSWVLPDPCHEGQVRDVCAMLMALTFFFNKHLEELVTAEGIPLDTLSPRAHRNSCWNHPDVGREALLACLASANAPGWEYTLYYMQSLPGVHNTFKHVWSLNRGIVDAFFNLRLWATNIRESVSVGWDTE